MATTRPDYRKGLDRLREEWDGCQRCSLWEHREAVDGEMVFGEGVERGVLLVGEGPGIEEEKQGRPFIGRSGSFLREVLMRMSLENYYLTNTVICRSCEVATDKSGKPILRRKWGSDSYEKKYVDRPPLKPHKEACETRLHEEIYLVDPVVIVALGKPASESLLGRSVTLSKHHGVPEETSIPGAVSIPHLTPKGKWARKVRGELIVPTVQNRVRYLVIPTYHPAHVLRTLSDEKERVFDKMVEDLRAAVRIYDRYRLEVYGISPGEEQALTYDDILEIAEEEVDNA